MSVAKRIASIGIEAFDLSSYLMISDEEGYIKKIEELLKKKILRSKVPGPWNDLAKNPERTFLSTRPSLRGSQKQDQRSRSQ